MNERVRELRMTCGLSAEAFGKAIGVTRSAISNMENGKRNLTDQTVRAICREFNVNESWLRTGEGPMFNPEPESEMDALVKKYNLSETDKIIVKKFVSMPEKEREIVRSYILSVAEEVKESAAAPQEPSIDELVEEYRRQLEAERKGGQSASHTTPSSKTVG